MTTCEQLFAVFILLETNLELHTVPLLKYIISLNSSYLSYYMQCLRKFVTDTSVTRILLTSFIILVYYYLKLVAIVIMKKNIFYLLNSITIPVAIVYNNRNNFYEN